MAATRPATILHLSDLQFGLHHRWADCPPLDTPSSSPGSCRYHDDDAFNTLFSKLDADLALLKQTHNLLPNILVISGDIAEWSVEDEYSHALVFLDHLLSSTNTDISRDRIILVPGNHDVNWDLCDAYFHDRRAHRCHPDTPYWPKFKFWNEFVSRATDIDMSALRLWHPYDFSTHGLLAVGLNSCVIESHQKADHFGHIGIDQAQAARNWFISRDPSHEYAHIVVLHHNATRGSARDDENLRDWDDVQPVFANVVDIILHGHRHQSQAHVIGTLDTHSMFILGAGSAGLDSETLPSCPNQYQILTLAGNRGTLYSRRLDPSYHGSTGRGGAFVPDADPQGKWVFPLELRCRPAPMGSTGIHALAPLGPNVDRYRAIAREVLARRFEADTHKLERHLQLDCEDLRTRTPTSLTAATSAWLMCDSPQMVLLGSAGSGKTVACHHLALACYDILDSCPDGYMPIYLDLGHYDALDDILDILCDHFRALGFYASSTDVLSFLDTHRAIVILDAFDEYDRAGAVSVSDRDFKNFDLLRRPNLKTLVACRSSFFRVPEEIFHYDMPRRAFELCSTETHVHLLHPLSDDMLTDVLHPFLNGHPLPAWIADLARRPLYLCMLIPLLRYRHVALVDDLKKHELYERFVRFVLIWDLARRSDAALTFEESLRFHIRLAEALLAHGAYALDDTQLSTHVRDFFGCNVGEARWVGLLFLFRESGLLRSDSGRLVFAHKSVREYLVAQRIVDDIIRDNDTFDFIWFTRDERDFITAMIGPKEIDTLCRWLSNEHCYAACNYAAFILGGTNAPRVVDRLRVRYEQTDDSLVKVNCANALAFLGDTSVNDAIAGMIAGYALDEKLITVQPSGVVDGAVRWCRDLSSRFNSYVMLIHLCESIEALSKCGDEAEIALLQSLRTAPDPSVCDEARIALQTMTASSGPSGAEATDGERTQRNGRT